MTEIDVAFFNFEHVLSAYLRCLFAGGARRPAGRLVTGLSRVAFTAAVHVDDLVFVPRLEAAGRGVPVGDPGKHAGAGRYGARRRSAGAQARWRPVPPAVACLLPAPAVAPGAGTGHPPFIPGPLGPAGAHGQRQKEDNRVYPSAERSPK
jgi:hypothetical protein